MCGQVGGGVGHGAYEWPLQRGLFLDERPSVSSERAMGLPRFLYSRHSRVPSDRSGHLRRGVAGALTVLYSSSCFRNYDLLRGPGQSQLMLRACRWRVSSGRRFTIHARRSRST